MKWIRNLIKNRRHNVICELWDTYREEEDKAKILGDTYFKSYSFEVLKLKREVLRFERDLLKSLIKE